MDLDNWLDSIPAVNNRRKTRKALALIKWLSVISLVLIVLCVIPFLIEAKKIARCYRDIVASRVLLYESVSSIKSKDFFTSVETSARAENLLRGVEDQLLYFKTRSLFRFSPIYKYELENAATLVNSLRLMAKSIRQGSEIAQNIYSVINNQPEKNFSAFSDEDKKKILQEIYESAPELNGIKADLDLSLIRLNMLKLSPIFWSLEYQVVKLRNSVEEMNNKISDVLTLAQIIPALGGYPKEATYLMVLQNSDELRPTGGFIGTYGILSLKNGDIERADTHDIYHMDMPVKDKISITPPAPIRDYIKTDKWYMRDSNWSPDWPTSARNIEKFYHLEDKLLTGKNQINNYQGDFDGIIALTPRFITDLLWLVGPVHLDGQEYNKDNFVDILQYKVEKGYYLEGIPSWQRKEVIGRIMTELKFRLLNMPFDRYDELTSILRENFARKDVQLYFADQQIALLAKEKNYDGALRSTESDYVFVVDANLAALKTDAVMDRKISYVLNDGKALLKLTYAHNGSIDWRTSKYQSYTRVYVPLGSKLINIDGIGASKADEYEESGKTVFGFYFTVSPQAIKEITLNYRLPDKVAKDPSYSLIFQKQAGNNIKELSIDLQFSNAIRSYSPQGFSSELNGRTIKWQADLLSDKKFEVNF